MQPLPPGARRRILTQYKAMTITPAHLRYNTGTCQGCGFRVFNTGQPAIAQSNILRSKGAHSVKPLTLAGSWLRRVGAFWFQGANMKQFDSFSVFIAGELTPSKFSKWLAKQYKRDDPIGDLARDARSDYRAPWQGDISDWESYLRWSACKEAIETFYEAVKERQPQDKDPFLVTLARRYDVLKRDKFRCCICGRSAKDNIKLEVDHKFPKSKGGTNDLDNLWTLCFDCNRGKKAKLLIDNADAA
jgi:hypothetical protein